MAQLMLQTLEAARRDRVRRLWLDVRRTAQQTTLACRALREVLARASSR